MPVLPKEFDGNMAIVRETQVKKLAVWETDRTRRCTIWTTRRCSFEEITATLGNGFAMATMDEVHVYV